MKKLFGRKSSDYRRGMQEFEYEDAEYEGEYSEDLYDDLGEYEETEEETEYTQEEYYQEEYYQEEYYQEEYSGENTSSEYEEEVYYEEGDGSEYYEDEVVYDAQEEALYGAAYLEDEDLEYDDEDELYGEEGGFWQRLWYSMTHMSAMDRIITTTGVLILVLALVVGAVYASARILDEQVSSFDSVGSQLSGISLIGEAGLMAVADAEIARINAANALEEEKNQDKNYNENDYSKSVTVVMNMTSIEKDLKVKFVNERTNKLISNVPFVVEVTTPSGDKETWTDDDMDGIIYKKGIVGGNYQVSLQPLENKKYEKFQISSTAKKVKVKEKIVYEKVDVTDEVKDESEVDAKKEDTAKKDVEVESTLTDTVTWVESTKKTEYQAVPKSSIKEPVVASLGTRFFRLSGLTITDGTNSSDTGALSLSGTRPGETYTGWLLEETWESSDTAVATVAGDGASATVNAVAAGNTTITYTYTWKVDEAVSPGDAAPSTTTASQTWDIAVTAAAPEPTPTPAPTPTPTPAPVPQITLSKTEVSLAVGKSVDLTATVQPEETEVTWSSDKQEVATVDGGKVTAVAAGTANITAKITVNEVEYTAACVVTVSAGALTEVTLAPETLALNLTTGKATGELAVSFTGTGTFSKEVTWASSDETIVKVTPGEEGKAVVTAVKAGTATITVTSVADETKKASCEVTVTGAPITALTLDKDKLTVPIQGSLKLTAKTTPEGGVIVWSSDKPEIAKVDEKGVVTGVKEGVAVITATCGKLTAKCTVTVAKLMTLDKTTLTIMAGGEGTVTVTVIDDGKGEVTAASADTNAVTVSVQDKVVTFKGLTAKNSVGVTIAYTATNGTQVYQNVTVSVVSNTDKLTDAEGRTFYVKNAEGQYVEAVASDYYKYDTFYLSYTKYTGWQTIGGNVFFYDVNGKAVTGTQVIQGAEYSFASDGSLITGNGIMGIDVSKWNGTINWNEVKNSGVSYVIIRCGYRGSSEGALIKDPKFEANIKGATAAGLRVGVYFFSQAVDEIEAVEEASMVLGLIKDYKISYPVFLDVESSGGRADKIDSTTRTNVIKAFCETIQNSGYTAGVYANKTWLENKMNATELTKYKIWLAQYAASPTYTKTRYDMWQYKDTGKVTGISGNVDLNLSYLGY